MEQLLKIPYNVFNDWALLQQFLERRGNPRYELVGDVDLYYRKDIFNLGNLVRVDGGLDLFESLIQSLGNLVRVDSYLNLFNAPNQSLGNLEYVGGSLDLRYTRIQSLRNLEYIGDILYLSKYHQIPEEQLTKFKDQIEYY